MRQRAGKKVLLLMGVFWAAFILTGTAMGATKAKPGAGNPNKSPEIEAVDRIAQGNNAFALNLCQKLSGKKGNLFFSPFSISDALAMTYAGARGRTARQMESVLHFFRPQEVFHAGFHTLIGEILPKGQSTAQGALRVANALWGQKGMSFLPDFISVVKRYYQGGFFPVDFVNQTEQTRQRINKWVEKKTENKIKNLIHKGDITAATRLVLTNAIYFKGLWALPFKKKATQTRLFHVGEGVTVSVPMMFQSDQFPYYETLDKTLQVIELPYAGGALSMMVFLPNRGQGLKGLIRTLTVKKIRRFMASLRKRKVDLYLPRFTLKTRYQLGSILAGMGMPDAFSKKADFSGMTGDRSLMISKVIHQAYVRVDEEGTEAAAATGVIMRLKAIMRHPVFRADHPFLFMIIHKKTGSILFMGRVVNPLGK